MSDDYAKIRLVPVEVFGADDGYGLSDAVSAWSDCNRAYGKIYRVDESDSLPYRQEGDTVEVLVKKSDLSFFDKRFDNDKPYPTNYLPKSTLIEMIEKISVDETRDFIDTGEKIIYVSDLLKAIESIK